jgi:hypothetical protein
MEWMILKCLLIAMIKMVNPSVVGETLNNGVRIGGRY